MVRLEKTYYQKIYPLYLAHDFFFPLIASVILDEQDGIIYANHPTTPTQVYVEHAFGFAQLFGTTDEPFEQSLKQYWLVEQCFLPNKVRLYAPNFPNFLSSPDFQPFRSQRQRFTLNTQNFLQKQINHNLPNPFTIGTVNEANINLIQDVLGVVTRFWRTPADFIKKSSAIVVYDEDKPCAICYAAAEADQRMEIDVMTLPEYRNKGLGKHAVMGFIQRCLETSRAPLWDCFTNNVGSMMLARSIGFLPANVPYALFTLGRATKWNEV